MFPVKSAFLVALWLSVFNLNYADSRKLSSDVLPSPTMCMNCTICQYPCHPLSPPPPLSGYPSYGAPPPPPPRSAYPSYGGAPPPPAAQGMCPPDSVQCCHYPPPNTYGYLPYDNYSASSPLPLPFIYVMMLLISFAVLF